MRAAAVLVALAVLASACTSGSTADDEAGRAPDSAGQSGQTTDSQNTESESTDAETTAPTTTVAPTTTEPPLPKVDLELAPAFQQLLVSAQTPGSEILALADNEEVGRATVLEDGAALLRGLPAGNVQTQLVEQGQAVADGPSVAIPGPLPPDDSFFQDQELQPGFGYITTRDGITLSAFVTLPGNANDGPYPTLVEYSGYSPSDPNADDPTRLLMPLFGFALVQVNVRGTGCSGGSFDAFEPIQGLDGYDVIEVVAAQGWSAKVGMWGISYPGIMQLQVAATQPPSLAAIAPLSPLGRIDSVLYPGGIYNNGFGEVWTDRVSRRAGAFGQGWTKRRSDAGDQTCEANQQLRLHNPDLVRAVKDNPWRNSLTESRSMEPIASRINVPVFIAGAWQDEQTGGRFPLLLDELSNAPVLRATLYNGLHADALGPEVLAAVIEFYNLYVADRPPGIDFVTRIAATVGLSAVFGGSVTIPPDRFVGLTVQEARTRYEAEPPIRVLMEVGANDPVLPASSWDVQLQQWPADEAVPTRWYLQNQGRLAASPPSTTRSSETFTTDPAAGAITTIADIDAIWTTTPGWSWQAEAEANSNTYTTPPFESSTVFIGPASADLWVSVSGTDADLEVTLSEVGADGSETLIQSGWLRVSRRALTADSTELRPVQSQLEADQALLAPAGQLVLARVEILPFAHVIRPGSSLRLTVDTPGASRAQWKFDVLEDPVEVTIYSGGENPSSLVLPVVPGLDPPEAVPPCGSLRGQPCRP